MYQWKRLKKQGKKSPKYFRQIMGEEEGDDAEEGEKMETISDEDELGEDAEEEDEEDEDDEDEDDEKEKETDEKKRKRK